MNVAYKLFITKNRYHLKSFYEKIIQCQFTIEIFNLLPQEYIN